MTRTIAAVLALLAAMVPAPALADDDQTGRRAQLSRAAIIQEWNVDGSAADGQRLGGSILLRRDRGLDALAWMRGLEPGGVYTFWWVVVQGDGTFPNDIFVASGDGVIADRRGRALARMRARTGDPGIDGFRPDGVNEVPFADLVDPMNAIVRIEVAYHGQAADAGSELGTWLGDFWTGTACPPDTPNPIGQPHCPVYYAATHS